MLLAATLAAQLLAAACTDKDVTVTNALAPNLSPAWLKTHKPDGTVVFTVRVGPQGRVTSVMIKSASPNLDDTFVKAAAHAALHSTYSPAMRNCKAVAGSYLFKVKASPDAP